MHVLERSRRPRVRLTPADLMLWVWVSRMWMDWRGVGRPGCPGDGRCLARLGIAVSQSTVAKYMGGRRPSGAENNEQRQQKMEHARCNDELSPATSHLICRRSIRGPSQTRIRCVRCERQCSPAVPVRSTKPLRHGTHLTTWRGRRESEHHHFFLGQTRLTMWLPVATLEP